MALTETIESQTNGCFASPAIQETI